MSHEPALANFPVCGEINSWLTGLYTTLPPSQSLRLSYSTGLVSARAASLMTIARPDFEISGREVRRCPTSVQDTSYLAKAFLSCSKLALHEITRSILRYCEKPSIVKS